MSELRVEFNQDDLRKLQNFERQVPHIFQDVRLRKSIGQLLASQAKENINQGTPDGRTPYHALNAKYEKYKGFSAILVGRKKNNQTRRGVTNNRGVMSGKLRQSIHFQVGPGETIFMTSMNYGKYHQFGTDKMPARPIFSIRAENYPDIMDFIERAYTRLVNQTN